MTRPGPQSDQFILEAFDRDQWCPVLQALIHIPDLDPLRATLGAAADDDPELRNVYQLDDRELSAIVATFDVAFDPGQLESRDLDVQLFRRRRLNDAPYLIHTRYELPLLLDGRKKLARMSDLCPPATFEGEDRFESWVAKGVLHREEVLEPFDPPHRKYLGHRTVYYTPKGEEWRIPASKLIRQAAAGSGGWNEHFERLEGMLFGYEDWQNDWWINVGPCAGGFGAVSLCCTVTTGGLAWIEAAGFRALPPIERPALVIACYDTEAEREREALMREDPDSIALVRFNVAGQAIKDVLDLRRGGPWRVPADRIPQLNRIMRGAVVIVARRDEIELR
jgi:hypothetical protein